MNLKVRPMKVQHFTSPVEFRQWLEQNHGKVTELWVGFYKKDSGKGGITYPEALDEALCSGWIDGVRKRLDGHTYTIRFTPRKPRSIWSNVNIRRATELTKQGRMTNFGKQVFEARDPKRSGLYSFENRPRKLDPECEARFQANEKAWAYFIAEAPWYQRTASWWVMSAKKEETSRKRLATLIECSYQQLRIPLLSQPGNPTSASRKKAKDPAHG